MPTVTYRQCFVAYVDILGFRALIERLQPDDLTPLANTLRQAMIEGRIGTYRAERVICYYAKMFSDTVTMSAPVNRCTPLQFLSRVSGFQAALAFHGIFLRGAVTLGQHFEDNKILFGPALLQAIDLEGTVAKWPRIVIHPSVVSLYISQQLPSPAENFEKEQVEAFLRQDSDGIRYLNYMRFFCEECAPEKRGEEFLYHHRDYIIKEAKSNSAKLDVLAKYHWLAGYHNSEVERLGRGEWRIDTSSTFQGL